MLSLDDDWLHLFTEDSQVDYSFINVDMAFWVPLSQLDGWVSTSFIQSGVDWFRREFILEETEVCVYYVLHIEYAPELVIVYVNG